MNTVFPADDMGKPSECDLRHTDSARGLSADAERRVSVNKVFGAELPQEAADDEDRAITEGAPTHDSWLTDNVPPHHL